MWFWNFARLFQSQYNRQLRKFSAHYFSPFHNKWAYIRIMFNCTHHHCLLWGDLVLDMWFQNFTILSVFTDKLAVKKWLIMFRHFTRIKLPKLFTSLSVYSVFHSDLEMWFRNFATLLIITVKLTIEKWFLFIMFAISP